MFLNKDTTSKSFKKNLSVLKSANSTATSIKLTKQIKNSQELKKNNFFNKYRNQQENQITNKNLPKKKQKKSQSSLFEIKLLSLHNGQKQKNTDHQKIFVSSQNFLQPEKHHQNNKQQADYQKMKKVLTLFHMLNGKIKQNSDKIFLQNTAKQKTKQALKGICNNLQKNMSGLFNAWRRNIKVSNHEKKSLIYQTVIYDQSQQEQVNINNHQIVQKKLIQNFKKETNQLYHSQEILFFKQQNNLKKLSFDVIYFDINSSSISQSLQKRTTFKSFIKKQKQDKYNFLEDQLQTINQYKIKKMLNTINKLQKITILKSFMMIQSFQPKIMIYQQSYLPQLNNSNFTLCQSDNNLFLSLKTAMNPTKEVACSMINRLFNKHFTKQFKKWYFKTVPMIKKPSVLSSQNTKKTIHDFKEELKLQKLKILFDNLISKQIILLKYSFFEMKVTFMQKKFYQKEQHYINQKFLNIKQKQLLIQQLKDERQINQYLNEQVKLKNINIEHLNNKLIQLQCNTIIKDNQKKNQNCKILFKTLEKILIYRKYRFFNLVLRQQKFYYQKNIQIQ